MSSSARHPTIEEALLAWQLMPGQYALAQREPGILFESIAKVLQIADGRAPGAGSPVPSPLVRQAAQGFIRAALLQSSADHYAILGLARGADTRSIKEHYRLLMRLMHPDFAAGAGHGAWPADSAARVNRAYEVLSSASQRREYDASFQDHTAPVARPASPGLRTAEGKAQQRAASARGLTHEERRRPLKRLAGVFGAVGATALLVALLGGGGEREMLVRRTETAPDPQPETPQAPPSIDAPPELSRAVELAHQKLPAAAQGASMQLQSTGRLHAPRPAATAKAEPLQAARQPMAGTVPLAAPAFGHMPTAALATADDARPDPLFAALQRAPTPPAAQQAPAAAGITLAEAHPVLSKVLQQLETGRADGLIALLDREGRDAPGAQALVRHFAALVEGSRPVRVANAQFRAEPRDGRLLVTGHVLIQQGDAAGGKELAMQAEFVSRNGAVVMTRLARSAGDRESQGKPE